MLFSSFIFLFGFLPLTLALFYGVGRLPARHRVWPKVVLTLMSLGFYAFWRPIHLPLLLGSIVFNFLVGGVIQKACAEERTGRVKLWLTIGVLADVAMLGWFKYANFVADNISGIFGARSPLPHILLPLAISFFTFQKIAYLIDSARGEARKMSFLDFSLFAAFFPQLIAGPIVHYREVVPQLQRRLFGKLIWRNILVGLVILAIGLFKKTVIADTMASYVDTLYAAAGTGHRLNVMSGWLAGITYTFQVYFDFSGYSDMAIGLARMFGVKLPLNFHSPLRSSNIIDYWRRWHMTLQRFIYAYVFQPLSLQLNRTAAAGGLKGWSAFAVGIGFPILVTFVAVGAWHGAGWTFVLFGAMHAVYVCVNEAWRERRVKLRRKFRKAGATLSEPGPAGMIFYHALTLVAVIYANVLFRAHTVGDAWSIWTAMSGFGGHGLGGPGLDWGLGAALALCAAIVFLFPNTQQIMGRFDPAWNWREWKDVAPAPIRWTWTPKVAGLVFAGVTLFFGVMFIQRAQAVFLYFNF